ncbi:MAG: MotA/TolQ/ExbB proton channel family protein [Candidatus Kuenenia sp.]|nr:MotA/TolQ/ExbB proton channel family protein [Candidatus Kuenenia hertensis]
MINFLQDIFLIFSSVMLYPVMICLLGLFVWLIITLGGFIFEIYERKKQPGKQGVKERIDAFVLKPLENMQQQNDPHMPEMLKMPMYFREYMNKLSAELKKENGGSEMDIEYVLQDTEQKMTKEVDKLRLLIRVGPTLGLMGTIIPMGPALSALAQGDLEKLSSNLIIAFTTTVVGLAIGIVAYVLSLLKNRWVNEDIRNLEYFTEGIMQYEIFEKKTTSTR